MVDWLLILLLAGRGEVAVLVAWRDDVVLVTVEHLPVVVVLPLLMGVDVRDGLWGAGIRHGLVAVLVVQVEGTCQHLVEVVVVVSHAAHV